MASIKKYTNTKGTFYEISVYLGKNPITGKQINAHKRGFKTKKEASLWAETQRVELAKKGIIQHTREKTKITYREIYEHWLLGYETQVKDSTYYKTTSKFDNHILPIFGDMYVQDINTSLCQRALNTWYTTFVDYKKIYYYFKRILIEAMADDHISKNPCDRVVVPKPKSDLELQEPIENNFWDKEQLNKFLENCKLDSRPYIYAFFRLWAYTGLRKGEISALSWDDFNLDLGAVHIKRALTTDKNGRIIVGHVKTKASDRILPLDPITVSIMKKWKAAQKEWLFSHGFNTPNFVFTNSKNNFISHSLPSKWIKQIAGECGVPYITPHGIRHTHCTLLIEANVALKEVQRRMGHSDINTTLKIYTHVTNKQKTEAIDLFSNYMSV